MTAAATRLSLYNGALLLMTERKLTSIASPATEQSQKELDTAWDDGAVDFCLEQASWNFATRPSSFTYDPDITPAFGLRYVVQKPQDWIRTVAVCSDEYFKEPLLEYLDEGGYWFSDLQTIYIRYVSNDNQYGNDMSLWPQTFRKMVEAYLARETCERITQSRVKRADMDAKFTACQNNASGKDAFNQATKKPSSGSWVRSRGR